ncbi:UNKNOWN [Stylonychia lemnae]|uniref:Uncharacterized protein n=1 Tax=Stylonychia lemnae TaxID=5949 RepID=A0A078A9T6_STYLE|nr:UNKNOWN [Stylonychia lemnae]|eukprot:CDW77558.1 UNKNOWN [Stylonychia lemnae]
MPQTRGSAQMQLTQKEVNDFFKEKFGRIKSDLLDSWLEMDAEQLIQECNKFNLKSSTRHIENIQVLFDFVKKFEKEIQDPKKLGSQQMQQKRQENAKIRGDDSAAEAGSRHINQIEEERRKDNLFFKSKQQHTRMTSQAAGEYPHTIQFNNNSSNVNIEKSYLQSSQNKDVQKAKESLNEQVMKILNKRRKNADLALNQAQQVQKSQKQVQSDGTGYAAQSDMGQSNSQQKEYIPVQNPFKYTNDKLLRALQRRGDLSVKYFQPVQFNLENPKMIDQVFGMTNDQIEDRFQKLSNNPADAMISQMGLTLAEYQAMQGIIKKKVIMNIEGISQQFTLNPNIIVNNNKILQLDYINENFNILNEASKEKLRTFIDKIFNDQTIRLKYLKDYNKGLDLCQALQNLKPNGEEAYKAIILEDYLYRNDSIYNEFNLDKASNIARVINYVDDSKHINLISQFKNHLTKSKDQFHNQLKKILSKKSVGELSFQNKLNILQALPKVEDDTPNVTKSPQYTLLNDILANDNSLYWENIDKKEMMQVIDKAQELLKCRDIQNRLKSSLMQIRSSMLNIDEINELLLKLTEGDKMGQIDSRFITNILLKKNIKTLMYIPSANEIGKHIRFLEIIYEKAPLTFISMHQELKHLYYRLDELQKDQYLKIEDMVKLAKFMIPSLYQPDLMFEVMIQKNTIALGKDGKLYEKPQTFRDADMKDLYQLIFESIKRMEENTNSFEHLQLSQSRFHKQFRPFKGKTLSFWWKVLDDFILENKENRLNNDELKIINKLLSNEKIFSILFTDSEVAKNVITKTLQLQKKNFQEEKQKGFKAYSFITQDKLSQEFTDRIQSLKALTNMINLFNQKDIVVSVNEAASEIFSELNDLITRTSEFKLEDVFQVNKAALEYLQKHKEVSGESNRQLNNKYEKELHPLKEIVMSSIEYHYDSKKPQIQNFDKINKKEEISKKITDETNKFLIDLNIPSIITFLNLVSFENGKHITQKVLDQMISGRSLVGNDLLTLINLIEKHGLIEANKQLMVNVAANLQTIEIQKINNTYEDPVFESVNHQASKKERDIKTKIIKKYQQIFQHSSKEIENENPLNHEKIILSPLSKLMADVIEDMSADEVMECLKILGNQKLDNYHEDFIKQLYEKYSSQQVIDEMYSNNQKFFFKFAKSWPNFLKNNAILNKLLSIKGSSSLPKQQSEILGILTSQNIFHQELLEIHFDTFIKMKDKESVANYIKDFLHYSSYLGYSQFDIQKCTQVLRRIYPNPESIQDVTLILDYLVVLAVSGDSYEEFDEKSKKFVEACIDYIDDKFTGTETKTIIQQDPITGEEEKINIKYFKSIQSTDRVYQKVQVPTKVDDLDFKFIRNIYDNERPSLIQKDFDIQKLEILGGPATEAAQTEEGIIEQASEEGPSEFLMFAKEGEEDDFGKNRVQNGRSSSSDSDDELNTSQKRFDSISKDLMLNFDQFEDDEKSQKIKQESKIKNLNVYDRKASESQKSEEFEFHQYRKRKIVDLDKKSKHLLLFSNINQMNFVDVNKNNIVKAWTVLYHFKSKTFDSALYDEFESVVMRNCVGKGKGHEWFSKFYLKMVEKSYDAGYRLQLAYKCPKTGWPIDIQMTLKREKDANYALYFLLQEEVCVDSKSNKEEPLGIQKLMLKHMKMLSENQVVVITENNFYANKNAQNNLIEFLLYIRIKIPKNSVVDIAPTQTDDPIPKEALAITIEEDLKD